MLKSKKEDTWLRPGLLLALLSGVVVLVAALWYLRAKQATPTETVAEAAVEERPVPTGASPRFRSPGTHGPAAPAVAQKLPVQTAPPPTLESGWGIQVSSMRLSMANSVVDLRYKVLDPEKAARLGDGKTASYIIDRSTGKKLIMPTPPKEGAFPPTAHKLVAGKTYFSMVSNQGGAIKSGSEVTVVVGGSEATNLTVQ